VPFSAILFLFASGFGCTTILGDFELGALDADAAPSDASPESAVDGSGNDSGALHFTAKLVTAGARHTCALTDKNDVYCWGDNAEGQLGLSASTVRSERPVKVTLPSDIKTLVAGSFHTCAVTTSFDAYCWGRNACGQVGAGDEQNPSREPRKVVAPNAGQALQWSAIGPGVDHTCGIESGGATYCWGCNTKLQAGAIGANPSSKPLNAGTDKQSAIAVSAGTSHTCIVGSASNQVRCWGTADHGALGDGPPLSDATSTAVSATIGSNATAISAGDAHTCAIDANKNAVCWGDNSFGQLGNPNASGSLDAPGSPIAGLQALAIGAGGGFTCLLASVDSTVRCFGSNKNGELGRAGAVDTATHPAPEAVVTPGSPSGQLKAANIGVGREHACAILSGTNEVVCWGKGADGQLGDGTAGGEGRTSPVFVLLP
jgi:alpha-tubulin suppressor-like RCC1 family protein